MTDIHIPDEVWRAAMSTYHKAIKKRPGSAWQEAIAAALAAWPGMQDGVFPMDDGMYREIILPLPQKEQQ